MKQGRDLPLCIRKHGMVCVLLVCSIAGLAQSSQSGAPTSENDAMTAAVHELQKQVSELRAAVAEVRSEAAQYRAETAELRHELQAMRVGSGSTARQTGSYVTAANAETVNPSQSTPSPQVAEAQSLEQRVASLEESSQLLNSKQDDQYQSKIESASKYRVRLSGIVLMNLFNNRGQTDNQDLPSFVTGPNQGHGSFGATLRQSEIGLEVFGPTIAGAKTSANLQADFAGGFANTWNGVDSGIFRLRIANMRMDWSHTSIVVGQDDLFVSPRSPTSFASLAIPAFNYAGNLWAWTPQVRVEHRFEVRENQSLTIQGGIFDNLTGEFPADSFFRSPGPGERSGQPAYGARIAWGTDLFGRPLTLGAAGYYSRQVWGIDSYSDGWAGMLDWEIPLAPKLSLSGEFYRGRSVGGIGGGISRSVVYLGNPSDPNTPLRGLDSMGGWSQLKFKVNHKLEFNAGFGLDNPKASELRVSAGSEPSLGPLVVQNRSGLLNFIYRPRSNLVFSTEYRHLQSFQLYNVDNTAEQVNLVMGILF